ncbi:MAG TPA: DUF2157 domain-containing protein [Myxococcota bacterium]|nr:DUF2157 domain-containing protein [Myxococcota bacterium]
MDDQPAGARQLLYLRRQGKLSDAALRRGLALIDRPRDPREWAELSGRGLAAMGVALLSVAVIYFVAYNWDHLERGDAFVAAQVALGLLVAVGLWRGPRSAAGFASSLGIFLLIGASLALFGQTYQTGRDPWELFAGWALLSVPLVAVAGSSALLVMAVEVGAVGLALWWRLQGSIELDHVRDGILVLSLWHLVPLLLWELAGLRYSLPRWPVWIWMFFAWIMPTLCTAAWMFKPELYPGGRWLALLWLGLTLLQGVGGRLLRRDRALLAFAGVGVLLQIAMQSYIFVDKLKLKTPADVLAYGVLAMVLSGLAALGSWGIWKGGEPRS